MANSHTYIISDLHLGAENAPADIEPLVAFLSRLKHCQLLILGDFLDRWALPISTKPLPYNRLLEIDSKCKKVTEALQACANKKVKIFCMRGNHDFDLMSDDLPHYIKLTSSEEFQENNPGLYAEHGNGVDLFNADGESDDGLIKYPLGYFKTRLNHTGQAAPMQRDICVTHAKEEIIAELEGYHKENSSMPRKTFNALLDNFSARFLDALLKDVRQRFPGTDIHSIRIEMPGNSSECLSFMRDVFSGYQGFVKRFYYDHLLKSLYLKRPDGSADEHPIQWEALIQAIDPVRNGGLKWYAEALKTNNEKFENVTSIVFGHTHMTQLCKGDSISLAYANSGCWCSNILGPNTTSIRWEDGRLIQHNDDVG